MPVPRTVRTLRTQFPLHDQRQNTLAVLRWSGLRPARRVPARPVCGRNVNKTLRFVEDGHSQRALSARGRRHPTVNFASNSLLIQPGGARAIPRCSNVASINACFAAPTAARHGESQRLGCNRPKRLHRSQRGRPNYLARPMHRRSPTRAHWPRAKTACRTRQNTRRPSRASHKAGRRARRLRIGHD